MTEPALDDAALFEVADDLRVHLGSHRERLVGHDSELDPTRLPSLVERLEAAGVGFTPGVRPMTPRFESPEQEAELRSLLGELADQVRRVRAAGAVALGADLDAIDAWVACSAPDPRVHLDLLTAPRDTACILHLGDGFRASEEGFDKRYLIRALPRLRALYLFGNELTDEELECVDFEFLKELEVLDLSENRLTRIPPGVFRCPRLRWLSLRNNQLGAVPTALGRLERLRHLDVSGNPLEPTLLRDAWLRALLPKETRLYQGMGCP